MRSFVRSFVKCTLLSTFVVSAALLSGCVADTTDPQDEVAGEESIATADEALVGAWTPFTSDEDWPLGVSCIGQSMINQVQCTGRYCDNVRLYCAVPDGGDQPLFLHRLLHSFSDEGGNGMCDANEWVTSFGCSGRYCDNIWLTCTNMGAITPTNCHWTPYVSEENGGTLDFGPGFFATGAQCSGNYCDNMRFYVCQTH
jgi:hypothetical protein